MNEKIKELLNEATSGLEPDLSLQRTVTLNEMQNFAELIVKECIIIVEEQKECLCEEQQYWSDHDYGYEMAVNDASKGIKQFFGVEE